MRPLKKITKWPQVIYLIFKWTMAKWSLEKEQLRPSYLQIETATVTHLKTALITKYSVVTASTCSPWTTLESQALSALKHMVTLKGKMIPRWSYLKIRDRLISINLIMSWYKRGTLMLNSFITSKEHFTILKFTNLMRSKPRPLLLVKRPTSMACIRIRAAINSYNLNLTFLPKFKNLLRLRTKPSDLRKVGESHTTKITLIVTFRVLVLHMEGRKGPSCLTRRCFKPRSSKII